MVNTMSPTTLGPNEKERREIAGNMLRKIRIKKYESDASYSLNKIAKSLNISAPFLSKIERGDAEPTDELLSKMGKQLSVDNDYLFGLYFRLPPDIKTTLINHSEQERCFELIRLLRTASAGTLSALLGLLREDIN